MRAARVGDTDELRQLLEAGMDPGRYVLVDQGMVSPMAEQVTALHLAHSGATSMPADCSWPMARKWMP